MNRITIPGDTIALIETARAQMRQVERLLSGGTTPEAIRNARKAIARMPSKVALKRGLDRAIERSAREAVTRSDAFSIPAMPVSA